MPNVSKLKDIKPWEVLGCSRRDYEKSAPWKRAKMKRSSFEKLILSFPEGFMERLHLEADVERLVTDVFKIDGEELTK